MDQAAHLVQNAISFRRNSDNLYRTVAEGGVILPRHLSTRDLLDSNYASVIFLAPGPRKPVF
jgi:hypothetical protein